MAVVIQKYARMMLARKERKRLKLEKCINLLQNYGRRVLAKRKVEMMIAERMYFAKKKVAIKI
jgi:hypothetical protein